MVAALKFFLGNDPDEKNSDDSDSDDEPTIKEVSLANRVNKKSRKRDRQLDKVKKLVVSINELFGSHVGFKLSIYLRFFYQNQKSLVESVLLLKLIVNFVLESVNIFFRQVKNQKKKGQAPVFNFSALHLIHDPQGMSEKLLKILDGTNKRFEVKLMILDVISRLIGLHDLFLFNYYPYIQRFLQPHQREVTKMLQFVAQASHALIPPDVIEPVLKTIVNNFVTERNSSDAMAIGLNAVRELCARCPLAMNEDLLRDLAQYKLYKEKSVMMAARSLIQLFRKTRPELLHRKDRGRPTEASTEHVSVRYGETVALDYVPGAEVLMKEKDDDEVDIGSDSGDETGSDDDEWVDIKHSSDEENGGEENEEGGSAVDKKELAKKAVLDRILTDEDFKRIEIANAEKQVKGFKKGTKRKAEPEEKERSGELVRLGDIENIYKKRKHDKLTRLETVERGRVDRERYGYRDGRMNENCSKTNREKRKKKNFLMLKHKANHKVKRSFKDKQIALRNHLLKQKKMK